MTPSGKDTRDPRLSMAAEPEDVRPVVALSRAGVPPWMLGVIVVAVGVLLFTFLDARRRAADAPNGAQPSPQAMLPASPPPTLVIPPILQQQVVPAPPVVATPAPVVPPVRPTAAPDQYVQAPPSMPGPPQQIEPPPAPARVAAEPALVLDTSAPRNVAGAQGGGAPGAEAGGGPPPANAVASSRARAGVLANRSTTVPQGTLIPAVLETALDSTRPGLARAIVSRDIRGFDGQRILIPRGSRLIGEYQSETQPGQRRALVNWFRLVRPDGATIAIDSPAGDPLGRGGIRARVNTHFFERFGEAILQSALDIGVNVAAARAGVEAVVVVPGAIQGSASQAVPPRQVTPTLTVRQGTSISIFVARDLDFTGVEGQR